MFDFAFHTETEDWLVLYRPLYTNKELEKELGKNVVFARPLDIFTELVEVDQKKIPRFTLLEETSYAPIAQPNHET